jgi:hypothetical protein
MNQLFGPGLDFIALTLLAAMTPARGARLLLALLALAFGIGVVNVLDEAVTFQVMALPAALAAGAMNTAILAALCALSVLVVGKAGGQGSPPLALRLTAPRVLGLILVYVALYFVAGMLIYPFVRGFYAGTKIPGLPTLLAMQAARGAVYVASCLLLLRQGPGFAPLTLGVALALIAGLAPLAGENPLMPAQVRAYHAIEIGWSNFVFGALMAWVLTPRRRRPTAATLASPAT